MAQAKKKTARKKTTTRRTPAVVEATPIDNLDPARVRAAIETLQEVVDTYQETIAGIPNDGEMPQELIAIAQFAQSGKGALSDLDKLFSVNAIRLRQGKGRFEDGALRVEFELVKGKKSPKWRDLAIENRQALCEANGDDFDPKAYEEQVKTNTKASADKHKPVIREVS